VTGADVVIPEPARLGALRLAWLRARHRGRLVVGDGVRLGRDAQVRIARGARVELGDGCYLGEGCRVEAVAGTVRVGPVSVGERARVAAHATVASGAAVPAAGAVGSYQGPDFTPDA
jgi:UDP-3-O-[3-hydroxymyristoyl] glucosamine N-acyltransferase